jgi:Zn-dependent peptidase ImmA (M78 family)
MQINTTSKGDLHEDRVYRILQKLLADDALFVLGKSSKLYRKKGYYSRDRETEIIFDISIETFLPGAQDYSLLTLIECKDYATGVPVNDVEEFANKVNQVGQHNTKAILISNGKFQSGTQKVAKNQQIALARINPKDEIQWILHRKEDVGIPNEFLKHQTYLFNDCEDPIPFAAISDDTVLSCLPDLLLALNIIDRWTIREEYLAIPYLSHEDIDLILERFAIERHFDGHMLDFDCLCEHLSSLFEADFDFSQTLESTGNSRTLGKIMFSPLRIFVDKDIQDKNRFRYTLAHEIGHLLLHLNLLRPHFEARTDTENQVDFGIISTNRFSSRLEIQANMLASQLLLPTRPFVYFVLKYFQKHDIHHGRLFVDLQPCNQHAYYLFLNKIQQVFGVSKEVARIRLIKLGLLIDTTDNSLRSVLQKAGYISASA